MGLVKPSAGEKFDQSQPQDGISETVCRCGWDRSNFLWPWSNFEAVVRISRIFFVECGNWTGSLNLSLEVEGIGQAFCRSGRDWSDFL